MARMRVPCFGCRTPLVFDEYDVGLSCPQCGQRYLIEHEGGVFTLVASEAPPAPAAGAPADAPEEDIPSSAPPSESANLVPPAGSPQAAPTPASRAPLVASILTIGMMIGLCGGIVGGLGLAAVLYAVLLRPN
ncbi:MAG: hypothetical protein RMM58_12350 [Chloroflexota bacterium]|nr:hypothetical protein [Dehalococcoidia bacterium]MDW8254659.1 hypothetical protein [Chloroflexota bacterium]